MRQLLSSLQSGRRVNFIKENVFLPQWRLLPYITYSLSSTEEPTIRFECISQDWNNSTFSYNNPHIYVSAFACPEWTLKSKSKFDALSRSPHESQQLLPVLKQVYCPFALVCSQNCCHRRGKIVCTQLILHIWFQILMYVKWSFQLDKQIFLTEGTYPVNKSLHLS